MNGIPPNILKQLKKVLSTCGPFNNHEELRSVFVDQRIHAWAEKLPEQTNKSSRMNAVIDYLYDRENSSRENALVLFLQVLADQINPDDLCYHNLAKVTQELEKGIQEHEDSIHPASESSAATESFTAPTAKGELPIFVAASAKTPTNKPKPSITQHCGQDYEHVCQVTISEARLGTTRIVENEGKKIEVKIPPNVDTGTRVRIKGWGAPGYPPGDLYLLIEVEDDSSPLHRTGKTEPARLEKETTVDVILKSVGPNKINVMKVIRQFTFLDLQQTQELVDHVPSGVLVNIPKKLAEEAKLKLEKVGAIVEIWQRDELNARVDDILGRKTESQVESESLPDWFQELIRE